MGYAIDLLYVPAEADAAPASMIYNTNTSINVNGAAIRACGIIILKQKLRRRTGLHKLLHKAAALKLVPVRQPSAVLGAAGGHRGCAARPGAIAGADIVGNLQLQDIIFYEKINGEIKQFALCFKYVHAFWDSF